MPNRRITIILNSNQSKRITVLIPLPGGQDDPYNVRDHILAQARNKFRIKELNIIYQWGGEIVYDGDTLSEKIDEVLVSKGEAYIGPPTKHTRTDGKAGEVHVLASQSFVHEDVSGLAETHFCTSVPDSISGYKTARICSSTRRRPVSGPLARHCSDIDLLSCLSSAIGMPDLHKGDRFPIGCAIIAEGIYPALIGSDIGCGIALYPLGRIPAHLTPEKLASRLYNRNLDGAWDGSPRDWLARYGVTRHTEFDESLGTVGAGNHFAEICQVERIVDSEACESIGLREGEMYLLGELLRSYSSEQSLSFPQYHFYDIVHTGSRGLGSSTLRSFTKSDANPYFTPASAEFQTYLDQHDHAVKWAQANRDLVAHRIKYCLFEKEPNPLDAEEGDDTEMPAIVEADESKALEGEPEADPREALGRLLDVTHNAVARQGWVISGKAQEVWIHRKGAAPSDQGFIPCPGSRGDFSWILQPSGDGQINGM